MLISAPSSHLNLSVCKESFHFSAAHFLIFDEKRAERLHGHNYRVRLKVFLAKAKRGKEEELGPYGYAIDFKILKEILKAEIDTLDERVLLPAHHPEMKFHTREGGDDDSGVSEILEVRFRDRFYAFPKKEVLLLPLKNTSSEGFAWLLARRVFSHSKMAFFHALLSALEVEVEESPGQSASYRLSVSAEVG